MKDENYNKLSGSINQKIDGNEEELKFVIIGTNEMLNNIQYNLIEEFFMETAYSCVPQVKIILNQQYYAVMKLNQIKHLYVLLF